VQEKSKKIKKQKQLEKGKVSKRMPDTQARREGKAYTKTNGKAYIYSDFLYLLSRFEGNVWNLSWVPK